MEYLIAVLLTLAVAFPAGWLLCRAWLGTDQGNAAESVPLERHHALLKSQRSRYRRRVQQIHSLLKRHEASREQVRAKVAELQAHAEQLNAELDQRRAAMTALSDQKARLVEQCRAAETELRQLREQPAPVETGEDMTLMRIERDELLARLRRMEIDTDERTDSHPVPDAGSEASARAERGELRDRLAKRERRVRELDTQLRERDTRIEELLEEVESWKHRLAPLARQLQKQREIIRRGAIAAAGEPDPYMPQDDLQKIRGVGPALERRLRAQGVQTYAQLAAMSEADLQELADRLAIAPSLPTRDEWARQARELAGFSPDQPAVTDGATPA